MAAEEIGLVTEQQQQQQQQRMENGLNPQIVFQQETLQFNCGPPQVPPQQQRNVGEKMFLTEGDRYFATHTSEFRRSSVFDSNNNSVAEAVHRRSWSTDGSEDDEDEEDDVDDDDDEDDDVEEGFDGGGSNNNNNNNSSGSVVSNAEKIQHNNNENWHLHKHQGPSGGGMVDKDGNGVRSPSNVRGSSSDQHHHQGRESHYQNVVAIAEPDLYYAQFLQGAEGSGVGHKEIAENGCGFSAGKESSLLVESGESLRAILSDPITGTLMDDAMILPCGHSFGSGGLQHVLKMKVCIHCSQSVTEDSVAPNLSLRSAIHAFRREEELHSCRASKRRRERSEQDKSNCGDLSMYLSRGKGVQFPFAVTDRVIIKGNKRTPLRFVGREAVVTTQCLNGWYVVKTLDNAESVKLQYRSLAKVSDSPSSLLPSKTTPNWL